jgi:ribonuclease-3
VFLGDALLSMAVAMHLHFMGPDWNASDLTRLRATAVSDALLAQLGRSLGLGEFILMGKCEERCGGRERSSVLVDAVKALLAASMCTRPVDPGRLTFRAFVLRLLGPSLEAIERDPGRLDPKTVLGELGRRRGVAVSYRVVDVSGPDHDRTFVVETQVGNEVAGVGRGRSKKEAEQEAAKQALASEARTQPGSGTAAAPD